MRVTNEMMVSTALYHLRKNGRDLFRLQVMASSGKKLLSPSDDPLGAVKVMKYNHQRSLFEQYQRNIDFGHSWLQYTESILSDLEGLVSQAHEIAVSQSSDTADAETRAECAGIVRQIREQVWQLANSRFGDRYIFAGLLNDSPPYLEDGTYQGDAGELRIALGHNVTIRINLTGPEVLSWGSTDLFQELDELADALENNQPDLIAEKLDTLDQALRQLSRARSEVGARVDRLESFRGILTSADLDLAEKLSELEDADIAEVVTRLATQEAVYQASLMAIRRLLETNLVTYML